jgi:putative FmdB family regulatory protein
MPIYEYRCNSCGRIIEVMQKFSDKPLTKCPACSGRISRIISNCSFHLKGTGWYVTDYKKGDGGAGRREKTSETPKSEPKAETTESKPPEKKAEGKAAD